MSDETNKGMEEAIHRIAESLHSEIRDKDGRHVAPYSDGMPLYSLSHAVAAVAWAAGDIAEAIDRLAGAISETKGRDE